MSVINHETKIIYCHLPRTAGTSMEGDSKFGTVITGHFGIRDYIEQGAEIDFYFKFAFVRNPYDRLASAIFAYLLQNEKNPREKFNETVIKYKDKWPTQIATKPQYEYTHDISGNLRIDFIGRYENLEEDWKKLCVKLGIEAELTHLKKWPQYDYNNLYSEEARNIVRDFAKKDFEMFGYDRYEK